MVCSTYDSMRSIQIHAPFCAEEPEYDSDRPLAKKRTRQSRRAAPKKCMADEATDDEGKEAAAASDAALAAAAARGRSTAKKASRKDAEEAAEVSDDIEIRLESKSEEADSNKENVEAGKAPEARAEACTAGTAAAAGDADAQGEQ